MHLIVVFWRGVNIGLGFLGTATLSVLDCHIATVTIAVIIGQKDLSWSESVHYSSDQSEGISWWIKLDYIVEFYRKFIFRRQHTAQDLGTILVILNWPQYYHP